MNKLFAIAAFALAAITTPALAGDYVGADIQNRSLAHSKEDHTVYGVFYGHGITGGALKGTTVETRMEDEVVTKPAKHEGLFQVKASYPLNYSLYGVRPYVAGAVGYKSKATINFMYYVAEAGAKYTVPNTSDRLELKAATSLRSPFSQTEYHKGRDLYRTVETSAGAAYKLTAHDTLTAKAALETGDKHYNTLGLGFSHSF